MDDYYYNEPPKGNGFGIASLVLGILSLVLSCTCINIPLAIIAIVFGVIHLNRRTGAGGTAIGGIVTAAISLAITLICVVVLFVAGSSFSTNLLLDNPFMELPEEFYMDSVPGMENLPWESESIPQLQGENDL
ncbi:MAG: hypothetical protein PUD20_02685 [bacterium]|nr:hypothetical protein [bacterium]